ncbi:hypothetical protein KA005_33685, partial [bacterium]|nr:hypothetical protein [bacterium]
MSEYDYIDQAMPGLLHGLDNQIEGGWASKPVAGIEFGRPVFGYAGDEKALYTFKNDVGKIVFDADFVTLNSIIITVNGVDTAAVVFNTDHDTTMDDLVTQIEADIANSTVTLDPGDVNNRTLLLEVFGGISALEAVVTLGASQPIAAVTFDISADVKECAAWNETQKKIFFYASSEDGIKDPGSTTDLAYLMKNFSYDR